MSGRSSALRPGTASRLKAGTARADGKGSSALNMGAAVQFEERPITQQGLGGMKLGGRGTKRHVEDKTYFLGMLRARISELASETSLLRARHEEMQRDTTSFTQYESMAETMAKDIQELQGQLADANTLLDRLNTEQDATGVQLECDELKAHNESQEALLERLFDERKRAESEVAQSERELDQEHRMADSLVARMRPEQQGQHQKLRDEAERTGRELEAGQRELDSLRRQRSRLEEDLSGNLIKQEAVRLCAQLRELAGRRDALLDDDRAAGDPNQERERLLNQVREDNVEIGTMGRQAGEAQERLAEVQSEVRATEQEIEETSGQRTQQHRELRKRDEQMDGFLDGFEAAVTAEKHALGDRERQIVELLDGLSRGLSRVAVSAALPTNSEFRSLQEQLNFKSGEKEKADSTVTALTEAHTKLCRDAAKIDQLERKTAEEIETLKVRIDTMRRELFKFEDIGGLVRDGEEKREELGLQRNVLSKRRERMKRLIRNLEKATEAKRREVSENETHSQLTNLERKWQHHEQNNFVVRDFVASKSAESDTSLVSTKVLSLAQNLNGRLIDNAAKKNSI